MAEWDVLALPLAVIKDRLPKLEADGWQVISVCPVPSVTGPLYAVVVRREAKKKKISQKEHTT